jgi:hypothetical protein
MRDPYAASARGFLFEYYVIHLFHIERQKFEIKKLEDTSYDNKPKVEHFKNATDLSKYTENKIKVKKWTKLSMNKHDIYRPPGKNFI